MTLFRLSKERIARRSGWDWYFVPEDEREALEIDAEPQTDEGAASMES